MRLRINELEFEVDDFDAAVDAAAPDAAVKAEPDARSGLTASTGKLPIMLIMGLGMPRTAWPMPLVETLRASGHRVIRFDNRDSGQSSTLAQWGRPNIIAASLRHLMHLPVRSAYRLDDMARDVVGLLDYLRITRAHVVGVSMGGMIGQLLAADHGARVASFCCIMSSSGARHLPGPTPAVRRAMLSRPHSSDRQAIVDHYLKLLTIIGSPAYPSPPEVARARIERDLAPYYFPLGTARQLTAIMANGDRSARLARIRCPVRIIHGRADPLIPVRAAFDLKDKIAGAELEIIEGMGHDLPPALLPQLAQGILANVQRAAGG